MVLGIIGKIGSGKSAVVKYIENNYNTVVFSCDDIAKEIMEKGETDYDPGFAGEIFINEKKQEECRMKLHPLVFNRISENLNKLLNKNNLNHLNNENESNSKTSANKENFNEFYRSIMNSKNENNFYEKIIIIESALPSDEMFKMCDGVIYIDSPYADRVERLKETRDYPESKTKLIYDSQKYYEKYYDRANYKICNDGTKEELEIKVKEVLNEIYITCK